MIKFVVALALVVLGTLGPVPSPASAQSSGDLLPQAPSPGSRTTPSAIEPSDEPLRLRIDLKAVRGRDQITVRGAESVPDAYLFDLARAIGDRFHVSRAKADLHSEIEVGDDGDVFNDLVIDTGRRLTERASSGGDWTFTAPTADLLRALQLYGFEELELTVCPPDVDVMASEGAVEQGDDCYLWTASRSAATVAAPAADIHLVERPDSGAYRSFVVVLLLGVLVATVLAVVVTWLLRRRWLRTLKGANLALAVLLVGLAAFVWASASTAIAIAGPLADLALVRDLDMGAYALSIIACGAILVLPPSVAAIMLVRVPPPQGVAVAAAVVGAPGVPGWLYGMGSPVPTPGSPSPSSSDGEGRAAAWATASGSQGAARSGPTDAVGPVGAAGHQPSGQQPAGQREIDGEADDRPSPTPSSSDVPPPSPPPSPWSPPT